MPVSWLYPSFTILLLSSRKAQMCRFRVWCVHKKPVPLMTGSTGSQRERKDTQGKGKGGSSEHESNTSHSNSRDTDLSNYDDVLEEEMKLPGNLEELLKIRAVNKVLIRWFLRAIRPVAVVFYSFSESSQLVLLYSSWL